MSCQRAVYQWTEVVTTHMPHLSKPQAAVLALWSLGMVLARSCALTAVSLFLAKGLDRKPSLAPIAWNAEVLATAKRDLAAGELIDGIGGETVYGITDSAEAARAGGHVPLGLVGGARVLRDVPAGTVLTAADVAIDETTTIASLRRLQDRLLLGEPVRDLIAA